MDNSLKKGLLIPNKLVSNKIHQISIYETLQTRITKAKIEIFDHIKLGFAQRNLRK